MFDIMDSNIGIYLIEFVLITTQIELFVIITMIS